MPEPLDIPRLPADTPRVIRHELVDDGRAIIMSGHLFEDGLKRALVSMSVTEEHVTEVTAQLLEQKAAAAALTETLERLQTILKEHPYA